MPKDLSWLINIGAMSGALLAAWEAFRGKRHASNAADSAELAAERSEPTSNGFVRDITAQLSRIEIQGNRNTDLLVQHIADHAAADVLGSATKRRPHL